MSMALEGYKSNHNVVYSSKYHCVWTPKYRR
ncbi:MAG: IS200/IS605 family transposase, partial [Acidobacteria bacterium]